MVKFEAILSNGWEGNVDAGCRKPSKFIVTNGREFANELYCDMYGHLDVKVLHNTGADLEK